MECVIGLEIHVELNTLSKLFCACRVDPAAPPNSLCCPICGGLPGAMPSLNGKAVELAVRAGLALGCEINPISRFDRKHYFYPDLPKGYQITQYHYPICGRGLLRYSHEGKEKQLTITRIHLEEDAGKLIHQEGETRLNLNRCGVPLIEIVTEPELRSPSEAAEAFRELRRLLLFAGVTKGRMNEGNLRCDVNLSLHEEGTPFGTRCEIKNLNSFSLLEKACEAEIQRQREIFSQGKRVECMTLRFDGKKTDPMRPKETPADYRYMPEPDLPFLRLETDDLEQIRKQMPELPPELRKRWKEYYSLGDAECDILSRVPGVPKWFEPQIRGMKPEEVRIFVRLLCGEVFSEWKPGDEEEIHFPFSGERLKEVAQMQSWGRINATTGKALARRLTREGESLLAPCKDMESYAEENRLTLLTDPQELRKIARSALENSTALVSQYRKGKTKVFPAIMGKAMGLCGGRGDVKLLSRLLEEMLTAE